MYIGQITLRTTDKFEREETIDELQALLRSELSYLDNCRVTLSIPPTFGGSGAEIRCVMNGTDLDVLENAEMEVMENLPKLGLTRDLDSSRRERKPNINITPRRTVLQNLGMSANELYEYMLGSLTASRSAITATAPGPSTSGSKTKKSSAKSSSGRRLRP